ncbi:unnamed protein product [Ectocarpus sp. 12 AP-2014]
MNIDVCKYVCLRRVMASCAAVHADGGYFVGRHRFVSSGGSAACHALFRPSSTRIRRLFMGPNHQTCVCEFTEASLLDTPYSPSSVELGSVERGDCCCCKLLGIHYIIPSTLARRNVQHGRS